MKLGVLPRLHESVITDADWIREFGVLCEDEEQRAKMREILDQLDLPDGFGFILRTAGFDRTKLELKRDLAYLLRLWKDMEARLAAVTAPGTGR